MRSTVIWGAVLAALALLAGVLVWRAAGAHRGNAELCRRYAEAERELERLEAAGRRFRAELDAIENDPVYVESLLRSAGHREPGEVAPGRARPEGGSRGR